MIRSESMRLLHTQDAGRRVVKSGDRTAATVPELVAAVPALAQPEHLAAYCDAVNYLARGRDYRPIHDPEAYRRRYEQRYGAEDPQAPFQEGVPRLRDFGHAQTAEVQAPRVSGATVTFYAEDGFLGIPYRVTAPAPGHAGGPVQYEPVPADPDAA